MEPLHEGKRYLGKTWNVHANSLAYSENYKRVSFTVPDDAIGIMTNGTPFTLYYEATSVQSLERDDGSHMVPIPHDRLLPGSSASLRLRDPLENAVYEKRCTFESVLCCFCCISAPWPTTVSIPIYAECTLETTGDPTVTPGSDTSA